MDENKTCRCCLTKNAQKELNLPYVWFDTKEIYADMLLECFNITLPLTNMQSNAICDLCIHSLRSSYNFKKQVLLSEQKLLEMAPDLSDSPKEKIFEIKQEPKMETDDDSDNYFLADAVKFISPEELKMEMEEQPSTAKKASKRRKKSNDWNDSRVKLVKKLKKPMGACDLPTIKLIKKQDKKTLDIDTKNLNGKLIWNIDEKMQHRENLINILNFSNVTPFKDKSLLGFLCWYCDAAFPDPVDLRSHTEKDHNKDRTTFKPNFDLSDSNIKLDICDLTCTLCDEKIEDLTFLKEHLIKIHSKIIYKDTKDHILQFKLKKGEIYDCALCSSTYETFKMLKQHMNKHYPNYMCTLCDSSFSTKRSMKAHSETHKEGSFKCDHCEKVFPTHGKKMYHEKMKHLGTRHISNCPFCNEAFRSYYQRNQHLIKIHNAEAQYRCNICDKIYILKSLLMSHIKKNHLMERNCQCSECGYRFFSKKALKAHMVKHTGEKNYTCEICNKSYARKYTLREHMRIHNNDRRFKCKVCEMSFVQKCSLKSHLLSNHGISMQASDIIVESS